METAGQLNGIVTITSTFSCRYLVQVPFYFFTNMSDGMTMLSNTEGAHPTVIPITVGTAPSGSQEGIRSERQLKV